MNEEDKNFIQWESEVFGYGYGTGEEYTLIAICDFFKAFTGNSYDHDELANKLGPTVAWLLINTFCNDDVIEYGTSPRYGWLTKKGERLQKYLADKTPEYLYEMVKSRKGMNYTDDLEEAIKQIMK